MSHTPGPWLAKERAIVVEQKPPWWPDEDPQDTAYCIEFYGGYPICESLSDKGDEALVAAAPELLSVLGGVEEFLNGCDKATLAAAEEYGVLRAIRSVRARAGGGE